jgi:pyruvate formate lyase activating enzyme
LISAFEGTSLIDYPEKICSVIFFGGCNLYCPFCQNPELVRPDLLAEQYALSEDSVLERLKIRDGFVEAVCLTGGEPLLNPALKSFVTKVKRETGLLLKVDTNGTLPEALEAVIDDLDYVAMDIKASPEGYPRATGDKATFDDILECVRMVKNLDAYEFRTTMVPGIVDGPGVRKILQEIGPVKRYVLQGFRSGKTLSPEYRGIATYPREYLLEVAADIADMAESIDVRA